MNDFSRERLVGLFAEADRVVFRHDVDYDPACALEMAELEHEHGVRATFYVMARGTYNPFNPDVTRILFAIIGLGHALGTHVELSLPRDADTPDWVLTRSSVSQHRILSMEFPMSRKVSFHAPPASVYWREVPQFDHAMGPQWRDRHLADSRGVWRENPEDALEALQPGRKLQLNLHPEWWFWESAKADEWRATEAAKP